MSTHPKQAVARFKAAIKALGSDIPIGVDMGADYNLYGALHTIEMLDEYDLNFAEQPLHMYDLDNQILHRIRIRCRWGLLFNNVKNFIRLLTNTGAGRLSAEWVKQGRTYELGHELI